MLVIENCEHDHQKMLNGERIKGRVDFEFCSPGMNSETNPTAFYLLGLLLQRLYSKSLQEAL
jgi:hypothetical protein